MCVFMGVHVHTIEWNRTLHSKFSKIFEILYSLNALNVVSANEALYICGIEFIIKIDLSTVCERRERERKQSNADVNSTFVRIPTENSIFLG